MGNVDFLIKNAYKKFKSYIYYDNTMLFAKMRLAKFESDINYDENKLIEKMRNILYNKEKFNELLEEMDILFVPKNYRNNEDIKHYSNFDEEKKFIIEKVNLFIDLPIELHLISVMWIILIGEKLDKKISKNVYGYRLYREKDVFEENNYKLFYK